MKYKLYIIGRSSSGEEEILYKKEHDLLDECFTDIHWVIPFQISRKDVEMIIIKKKED